MDQRKRGILYLGTVLIILLVAMIYLYPYGKNASFITNYIGPRTYSSLNLTQSQLNSGDIIQISATRGVKLDGNGLNYTVNLGKVNAEDARIYLQIDNTGVLLNDGEEKKIDTNNDGILDLAVSSKGIKNNSVSLFIQTINQNMGAAGKLGYSLDNSIVNLQKSSRIQYYLIFFSLLIIFIFILWFMVTKYFMPKYKIQKQKAREDPVKMIKYLMDELETSKDKKTIASRIKHFYNYLSEEDKHKVKKKVRGIERYIN